MAREAKCPFSTESGVNPKSHEENRARKAQTEVLKSPFEVFSLPFKNKECITGYREVSKRGEAGNSVPTKVKIMMNTPQSVDSWPVQESVSERSKHPIPGSLT